MFLCLVSLPGALQCVLHVSSAQLGAGNLKTGGDTSVCPATNPLLKIIQMFLSFKSTSYKCSSQFPTNPLLKIIELYKSCSHKKFHHSKDILLMWRKSLRLQNIPFWENTKILIKKENFMFKFVFSFLYLYFVFSNTGTHWHRFWDRGCAR